MDQRRMHDEGSCKDASWQSPPPPPHLPLRQYTLAGDMCFTFKFLGAQPKPSSCYTALTKHLHKIQFAIRE